MAQPSLRNRLIVSAILLVACFLAAYLFAIPKWNAYALTKAKIATTNLQNEQFDLSLNTLQEFLDSYTTSRANLPTVNMVLPLHNQDTPGLLTEYSQLAQAAGVTLSTLNIDELEHTDKQSPPNAIQPVDVNLDVTGTYPAFRDFLIRLETHMRLMDIEQMDISEDESGVLTVHMVLSTYFQQ